jgi:hypothetical protein
MHLTKDGGDTHLKIFVEKLKRGLVERWEEEG